MANITGVNPPVLNDTDYVDKIKNSIDAIDAHDHTPGKGVAIPAGAFAAGAIVNADVAAAAAIARSKLASGTASHVVINDGTGVMSSEAQLTGTRGGTGASNAGTLTYGANNIALTTGGVTAVTLPTSGTLATLAGTENLSGKTFTNDTQFNAKIKLKETGGGADTIDITAPASSVAYTITLPSAAPTANTALAYDGANYVWSSAGGWTPRAEQNVTSNGTLTASTTVGQEIIYVRGVSNTNVSVSALGPFASGAWNDGITKRIVGLQDDATVTIIHSDTVDGVILNGDCTLARYDVLELQYDANNSIWFEVSRSIK